MDALRKALGELGHPVDDLALHLEGVRTGTQEYRRQGRGRAVEPASQVVVSRAEVSVSDVREVHQRAVGATPNDDALEVARLFQAPAGDHGNGELRARRRGLAPDAAGGIRGVLLLDRGRDVRHGEAELRHAVGVEAQQHREVELAERARITHAGEPLELVVDIDLRVVVQVFGVVPRIVGGKRQYDQKGRLALAHRDTVAHHFLRQLRLGEGDLILHVHGRQIRVTRDVEVDRQVHDPVARVRRLEVQQAFHARQLLLDRGGHRIGHVLRRCTRVDRLHLDLRWRERRIALDRQPREREQP